jgi:hypothetical protein
MPNNLYWDHLRRLARDGTTADSRTAREELLAANRTWHKDVKAANARDNVAHGRIFGVTPAPTKTTPANGTPTKSGATRAGLAAIQRAKTRRSR